MGTSADRAWKAFERNVAKRIGGQRWISDKGSNAPDIKHERLSPEVKYRSEKGAYIKATLRDAIAQARRNALPGKPWVVIAKERGQADDEALVVMDLAGFSTLLEIEPAVWTRPYFQVFTGPMVKDIPPYDGRFDGLIKEILAEGQEGDNTLE